MTDKKKTFVFDIDGTLCTNTGGAYTLSIPLPHRIGIVNRLYSEGHTIILATARGMGRHNNNAERACEEFYDFTKNQMQEWGVNFHHLFLGKPAGDLYIDDKGILANDYFK